MRLATSVLILAMASTVTSAATLKLNLAADVFEGGAEFEVLADDTIVGQGTAESAEGAAFQFEVRDNIAQVSVRFTNDAAGPLDESGVRPPGTDRNLIIISASLNDQQWIGTDFIGAGTFVRKQRLVLVSNTTVMLPIATAAVVMSASEQETEPFVEIAPELQSGQPISRPGCDLSIVITGYRSGVVNLSDDQKSLLTTAMDVRNCRVTVTGYSSTLGREAINEQVALDRAQAVLAYLVDQGGKFEGQEAVGAGETAQFGPNQADNRRVVIQFQ